MQRSRKVSVEANIEALRAEISDLTADRDRWMHLYQRAANETLRLTPPTRFKKPGPPPPKREDKDKRIAAPPRPMPRKKAILLLEDVPDEALQAACRKLGEEWFVDPATLIGDPPQRPRVLALLEIFESAGDLNQEEEDFRSWPREALDAPGFDGKTPLEIIQSGTKGLNQVRDFLRFLLQRTPGLLDLGDSWVMAGVEPGSECIMPPEDIDP